MSIILFKSHLFPSFYSCGEVEEAHLHRFTKQPFSKRPIAILRVFNRCARALVLKDFFKRTTTSCGFPQLLMTEAFFAKEIKQNHI